VVLARLHDVERLKERDHRRDKRLRLAAHQVADALEDEIVLRGPVACAVGDDGNVQSNLKMVKEERAVGGCHLLAGAADAGDRDINARSDRGDVAAVGADGGAGNVVLTGGENGFHGVFYHVGDIVLGGHKLFGVKGFAAGEDLAGGGEGFEQALDFGGEFLSSNCNGHIGCSLCARNV